MHPAIATVARWVRARRMRSVFRSRFAELNGAVDVFIISFPKSGRTWHRVALGHYLARRYGQPLETSPQTRALTTAIGGLVVHYNHNGTKFSAFLRPEDPLVAPADLWCGKRLLLIMLDPRDLVVSAHHHMVDRYGLYSGTLSQFLRDPARGLEKILVAYRRWHDHRREASAFDVVTYQSMPASGGAVLARTVDFCGFGRVEPAQLEESLAFASLDNVKMLENQGFLVAKSMKPGAAGAGAKVRSRRVGSFARAFMADDIAFSEAVMRRIGNPFASATVEMVS